MKRLKAPARAWDYVWIVALTLFAGFVYTDDLVSKDALLWDNIFFYSMFWNQLDSLNRFGEPAWWFPANQFGWPAYYYSILGDSALANPTFALLGLSSWVAGRLGMTPSFYGLFTFYYAYFIPGLVNFAGYFVLRQLVRSRVALWFGAVLMAFSPGVLVNVSDIGFLEPLAYSLFFFGCWIGFVRRPDSFRFSLLSFALALLALTIGFPFLIWNLFFIPLLMLLFSFMHPLARARALSALRSRPRWQWALSLALALLCALPALLCFSQTGDLVRGSLGQQFYDFRKLYPGNPLEMLTISLPQFGFEMTGNFWTFMQAGREHWVSIDYIALLALPLSFITLLYGRRWMRFGLLIILTFYTSVVALSAWSPLLSLVVRTIRPLQSNSHWPDLGFRGGLFLIFIFMAVNGITMLLRGHRRAVRALPWLILLNLAGCISIFVLFAKEDSLPGDSVFGLLITLSLLLFVVSCWLRAYRSKRMRGMAVMLLLCLTVIDVSTFAYLHMRWVGIAIRWRIIARDERQAAGSVGLERIAPLGHGDYADHILMYKPHYEMMQAKFYDLPIPQIMLFGSARMRDGELKSSIEQEKKRIEETTFGRYDSLIVEPEAREMPGIKDFIGRPPAGPIQGSVEMVKQTYNQFIFKLRSSAEALIFVRDAYSPYWEVRVNGQKVPVVRALFNFKAFVVPQGESEVAMRFSPPGVAYALACAYLVLFGLGVMCVRSWGRISKARTK